MHVGTTGLGKMPKALDMEKARISKPSAPGLYLNRGKKVMVK